jgi:hypothetical protein
LLDIGSFGRRGPERRTHLTLAEAEVIRRTLRRDPEVVVKVVSHGSNSLKGVENHVRYISRDNELRMVNDQGEQVDGPDAATSIVEDWNLDLYEHRRSDKLTAVDGRKPAKLVHKLILSMPPGTPPDKLLTAAQNFAREEFAMQHRYAMVMHTDEPHPHVHLVVKALSEDGKRLNIRKAHLRMWRSEFARHLREQGVRANATDRIVRGHLGRRMPDGKYRANERGVVRNLLGRPERTPNGPPGVDFRHSQVFREIVDGWNAVVRALELDPPQTQRTRERDEPMR